MKRKQIAEAARKAARGTAQAVNGPAGAVMLAFAHYLENSVEEPERRQEPGTEPERPDTHGERRELLEGSTERDEANRKRRDELLELLDEELKKWAAQPNERRHAVRTILRVHAQQLERAFETSAFEQADRLLELFDKLAEAQQELLCICHETVHGKDTCPVHGKPVMPEMLQTLRKRRSLNEPSPDGPIYSDDLGTHLAIAIAKGRKLCRGGH